MKRSRIYLTGAILLAAVSCAREESESTNEQSRQYIEAWVRKYYPQAEKTEFGIYILDESRSDGKVFGGEPYAFVHYTVSDMSGAISLTTEERIAKQIGSYDESSYYGPAVWYTAENNLSIGLAEALKGIRIGQSRKVLIPSWLMTSQIFGSAEEYFSQKPGNTNTTVYDITLTDVSKDIMKKQIDDVETFNLKYIGKLDSLSYGFYYKQIKAPSTEKAMSKDTSVYINYTGRLLDGKVFDTTIRDTAKKYGIYKPSNTYKPVRIKWADKEEDLMMYTSGSTDGATPVSGFQKLLWQMKDNGRSAGIFISSLGYGAQGSGGKIPAYAPLLFDVELTAKPE